jgi:hypothetical protein
MSTLCVVCWEEGLEEVQEDGEIRLILGGLGKLGMEDFHGEGCREWKMMYVPLCVILMEDGSRTQISCEVLLFY